VFDLLLGSVDRNLLQATSPSSISALPEFLHPLNLLEPLFGVVASILDQLNGYALVYVGITGEAFFPSARAVAGLIARRNRGSGKKLMDCTFLSAACLVHVPFSLA
jgi:hypothetical protein